MFSLFVCCWFPFADACVGPCDRARHGAWWCCCCLVLSLSGLHVQVTVQPPKMSYRPCPLFLLKRADILLSSVPHLTPVTRVDWPHLPSAETVLEPWPVVWDSSLPMAGYPAPSCCILLLNRQALSESPLRLSRTSALSHPLFAALLLPVLRLTLMVDITSTLWYLTWPQLPSVAGSLLQSQTSRTFSICCAIFSHPLRKPTPPALTLPSTQASFIRL